MRRIRDGIGREAGLRDGDHSSPTTNSVTPSPMATTRPAHSPPKGSRSSRIATAFITSRKLRPAARLHLESNLPTTGGRAARARARGPPDTPDGARSSRSTTAGVPAASTSGRGRHESRHEHHVARRTAYWSSPADRPSSANSESACASTVADGSRSIRVAWTSGCSRAIARPRPHTGDCATAIGTSAWVNRLRTAGANPQTAARRPVGERDTPESLNHGQERAKAHVLRRKHERRIGLVTRRQVEGPQMDDAGRLLRPSSGDRLDERGACDAASLAVLRQTASPAARPPQSIRQRFPIAVGIGARISQSSARRKQPS